MQTAAPSPELRTPPSARVLARQRHHHNHSLTSPTMAGTHRIRKYPRSNSATPIQITQCNCRGFKARMENSHSTLARITTSSTSGRPGTASSADGAGKNTFGSSKIRIAEFTQPARQL
ncbi:hypothetical protein HPB49_024784 [Dermacentor silvarum]|uniref:Uncharacterized protein n=1 Tax=Dermacentor silvarum TaxID=543639 RepID=A0ACB8CTT2_DERSI|nr:hypothetical protein HPB49_024784 [Dermacentor silvarum]